MPRMLWLVSSPPFAALNAAGNRVSRAMTRFAPRRGARCAGAGAEQSVARRLGVTSNIKSHRLGGGSTMTKGPFHPGEIAVQERVGVRAMAEKIGHSLHGDLPAVVQVFLREQRMLMVATVDRGGAVWASLVSGALGFVRAIDARTLRVDAQPADGDPLAAALRPGAALGLLAIDFATRRRMRVNGVAEPLDGGGFLLHVEQAFGNCPKYIQRRDAPHDPTFSSRGHVVHDASRASATERAWIEASDTFVIATAHPARGADASHRGGNPGFVRFVDDRIIVWPDYAGNMMFQTLGNLVVNPAAGLLFFDFAAGRTLQLSGQAMIVWDPKHGPDFAGAERLVEFRLERVIEIADSFPPNWRLVDASPFNPS